MPYSNLPKSKWDDMDRCVDDVMAEQGISKERAIAICYPSISESKGLLSYWCNTDAQKSEVAEAILVRLRGSRLP